VTEATAAHTPKTDKFDKSYYDRPIPKSGLQAAELEHDDFGYLCVRAQNIVYIDLMTKSVFLTLPYTSPVEATLQMKFYRQAYKDVLARRADFRVVN
jgi:hypothetical protein